MLARSLACTVAVLTASPAFADEPASFGARADALALLMSDQRTTYATALGDRMLPLPPMRVFDPGEIAASPPLPTDLAAFEQMAVGGHVAAPLTGGGRAPRIVIFADAPWWGGLRFDREAEPGRIFIAHQAVIDSITQTAPPQRRPVILDGRLVVRIDGDADTPTFAVGGGLPAALWNAMPRE